MQCSVLDGDDHRRLVRVALGIYRDFTGYPGKVLGPRNRVPQFLRIGTPGPFNRVGQEINGIVTKGSKSVGQFIVFLFIFLDELLHRR